jgi:hypothetical protein
MSYKIIGLVAVIAGLFFFGIGVWYYTFSPESTEIPVKGAVEVGE